MNEDYLSEFEKLVACDTSGPRAGAAVIPYFIDQFFYGEYGILQQATYELDDDCTNIIGIKGPTTEPGGLLLCSSLKTLPPGDPALWTKTGLNPLKLTQKDDVLYGHGVLSGKIDLLCKLLAANRIPAQEYRRPVYLAGVYGDEAHSQRGGALLLEHPYVRPTAALVGHPTNLELVREHRGHVVFRIRISRARNIWRIKPARAVFQVEFSGKRAHGTEPHLGRNAILEGMRYVFPHIKSGHVTVHNLTGGTGATRVPEQVHMVLLSSDENAPLLGPNATVTRIDDDIKLSFPLNDCLLLWQSMRGELDTLLRYPPRFDGATEVHWPTGIWNLGRIDTHPDGLSITYELRGTLDHDTEQFHERLDNLAVEIEQTTRQHHVEIQMEKDQPPLTPLTDAADSELVTHARASLRELGVFAVDGTCNAHTEAWLYNAYGIDTLVFGPGNPHGVLGQPNEYIRTLHVEKAISFYQKMIRKMCCERF